MPIKRTLFFLILICLNRTLYSQDSLKNISVNGFVETDHFSYFNNQVNKINSRNQPSLLLEFSKPIKKESYLFSSLELREDFSDPSRNHTLLKEAYIHVKYSDFDIRIGKQIIAWGKADKINPTNNINPIDYSDILDITDETLGLFMLNTKYYITDFCSIQGIFVPIFSQGILPNVSSRWYRNDIASTMQEHGITKYSVSMLNPQLPYNDIHSYQVAFNASLSLGRFDFDINYYRGYNYIPDIITSIVPVAVDSFLLNVQQSFYLRDIIGYCATTTIGGFGIRGESALFIPHNAVNNKKYFQYVIGADRMFSGFGENHTLYTLIQWISEFSEGNTKYSNLDLNHLFQRSILTRIRYGIRDEIGFVLQGIYNLKTNDYYIQPTIDYNISDGLNVTLSLDYLDGEEGGFFSGYKNNKRIQFKVKYSF